MFSRSMYLSLRDAKAKTYIGSTHDSKVKNKQREMLMYAQESLQGRPLLAGFNSLIFEVSLSFSPGVAEDTHNRDVCFDVYEMVVINSSQYTRMM